MDIYSAQFDKQRLPRPLKGRQIVKLFLRGVVGVLKRVLQRLHTKLELVQTECELVDARCLAILSGTCRQGLLPKVRWGWGALAEVQSEGLAGAGVVEAILRKR